MVLIWVKTSNSPSLVYVSEGNLRSLLHCVSLSPDEATSIIDDGLRKAVASMGQVSVVFHAVHNVRRRIMENRVPSLRQYKSIPENALKGSSISHNARFVRHPGSLPAR